MKSLDARTVCDPSPAVTSCPKPRYFFELLTTRPVAMLPAGVEDPLMVSDRPLPTDLGRADCVRFYQSELALQRDLVGGVWKWAIGPLIPGLTLLNTYLILFPPTIRRFSVAIAVLQAALMSTIAWLNLRAACRLDGRIKELDRELGSV